MLVGETRRVGTIPSNESNAMKSESGTTTTISSEEQKKLVDDAIERLDRLAESELDMARLFLQKEKPEIARRRLQGIVERYGKSDAAKEASKLLKHL